MQRPRRSSNEFFDLEFVEIAELTIVDDPAPGPSHLPTPAQPPVNSAVLPDGCTVELQNS